MSTSWEGEVQVRVNGQWESVETPAVNGWSLFDQQSYNLFSVLAGVRVYGCIPCIVDPCRGFPKDYDPGRYFDEENYTPHWFTLDEVLAFDWDQPMWESLTLKSSDLQDWLQGGEYPQGSHFSNYFGKPLKDLPRCGNDVAASLKTTPRERCPWFLEDMLPRLLGLSPNPSDIRVVCWFD